MFPGGEGTRLGLGVVSLLRTVDLAVRTFLIYRGSFAAWYASGAKYFPSGLITIRSSGARVMTGFLSSLCLSNGVLD